MNKLPFNLLKSDLDYPKYKSHATKKQYEEQRVAHTIRLYDVTGIGWVVATLKISNGGRSVDNSAARTYAVDSNGKVWRVGKGPHVLQTVTAYVTNARLKNLSPLVELYTKGSMDANVIRDRISSRRAQGALYRSQGRNSWRW